MYSLVAIAVMAIMGVVDSTFGPTTSIEIQCGGTYTGYLGSDEWKYWTFTTPSPQVVTFTNCNSDYDTVMYLSNEYGYHIQSQSTNSCSGDECYDPDYCMLWGTETFTMDPLSAGTYTLKLGWYWSSIGGEYEVNVICESGISLLS